MVSHPQYILLCHRETAHNVNYTDYAMTVYTYYPASETADIAGLVCTITAPEGNIIERVLLFFIYFLQNSRKKQ